MKKLFIGVWKAAMNKAPPTSNLQFQRDTSLVAGVRQYQPGDRFSWIDWKATARTNEMMAKEFEIRQSSDLLIVLDRTPSGQFRSDGQVYSVGNKGDFAEWW